MNELTGVLGDYVTVGMALDLLGQPREQNGRFYNLVSKGLITKKIGGTTLASLASLIIFTDLPSDTQSLWPEKLASIPVETLHSRNDAAEILEVTPRTINRYAAKGIVKRIDLSPWGGYSLYQVDAPGPHRRYIKIFDWTIEFEVDKGDRLNIAISGVNTGNMFAMTSLSSHPKKVFYHDNDDTPAKISVTVSEDL